MARDGQIRICCSSDLLLYKGLSWVWARSSGSDFGYICTVYRHGRCHAFFDFSIISTYVYLLPKHRTSTSKPLQAPSFVCPLQNHVTFRKQHTRRSSPLLGTRPWHPRGPPKLSHSYLISPARHNLPEKRFVFQLPRRTSIALAWWGGGCVRGICRRCWADRMMRGDLGDTVGAVFCQRAARYWLDRCPG
jgi:hypothetical protein